MVVYWMILFQTKKMIFFFCEIALEMNILVGCSLKTCFKYFPNVTAFARDHCVPPEDPIGITHMVWYLKTHSRFRKVNHRGEETYYLPNYASYRRFIYIENIRCCCRICVEFCDNFYVYHPFSLKRRLKESYDFS